MPSPIDPHAREVADALARLRADPDLSAEGSVRTLRWAGEQHHSSDLSGLDWLLELFRWLSQGSRVLVWIAAIALAALLGVYVYRLVRRLRSHRAAAEELLPTHVRNLDIRPESLPPDVGAAALELWSRGEHRAAMALLYRGLLSRLVHVHGVAIRASSTEGDCLAQLARHPHPNRNEYATRLVRVWQRAVYGAQEPDGETVARLCAQFSDALDAPPSPQDGAQAA